MKKMTKTELRKIAKEYGVDFDYVMDYKTDLEDHGWKVTWQDLADEILNGDL